MGTRAGPSISKGRTSNLIIHGLNRARRGEAVPSGTSERRADADPQLGGNDQTGRMKRDEPGEFEWGNIDD